jgi:hypothetical protein
VKTIQIGNGFGMTVRHAVSELPGYPSQPRNARGISPAHAAMQLLCPDRGLPSGRLPGLPCGPTLCTSR